jgi:hypothetical protein
VAAGSPGTRSLGRSRASIAGNELTIVGLEREDYAWVLREWKCEILKV